MGTSSSSSSSSSSEWSPASTQPLSAASPRPVQVDVLPVYPAFTKLCVDVAHVYIVIGRHIADAKAKAEADTKESKEMVTEYGREDLVSECQLACAKLGRSHSLHRITIADVPTLFADLTPEQCRTSLVLQLCDGTETDGYPGASVVDRCEALGLNYTGADAAFYGISTSKVAMKRCFDRDRVDTARWAEIPDMSTCSDVQRAEVTAALNKIGFPLLVKPDISYNSCGITPKSRVSTVEEAFEVAAKVREEFGSVYAEQFIKGREFTVLVCGDKRQGVRSWEATERVFDSAIPLQQRFLHLDFLWCTGQKETELDKWWYGRPPPELQSTLQSLASRAFLAVEGSGYARVDIRMDPDTKQIAVLEVNANCDITGWPNTSMGSIIEWSGVSGLAQIFDAFFAQALHRAQYKREAPTRRARRQRIRNIAVGSAIVVASTVVAVAAVRLLRSRDMTVARKP